VIAHYKNGDYAETYFCSGSHAVEWANDRAKPHRASWFAGCKVVVQNVPKHEWDYSQTSFINLTM
jgi:hypothetical protein